MRRQARTFSAAIALGLAGSAFAGQASLRYNSSQAYVGVPFPVVIDVTFEQDHVPPEFPELDGANVEEAGTSRSTNSSFQITFNGQRVGSTRTTLSYRYSVTPTRTGTLRIPSIPVTADGQIFNTRSAVFQVSKVETGDLMLLELTASRDAVYVGEPVDVTLSLWILPYSQETIQLGAEDMFSMVNVGDSSWGPFNLQEAQQEGRIKVRSARRARESGQLALYYVYDINKRIWPQRPGELDVADLRVIANYPLQLARERGIFGGLRVSQSKPITAAITDVPLTVKPIPTEGRPPYYQGAVGPASIRTSAAPTTARVGDPITLTLFVTGGGQLETLQAPRLAAIPDLTRSFQVADDPLPGVVEGNGKRFTQSIRALSADVSEIPPIPYAYFDTDRATFVTAYSDPIPLEIEAAEKLSPAQIVEAGGGRTGTPESLTRLTGGIEANYTDPAALLAQQGFAPDRTIAAVAATPPLVYTACALALRRRRRLRNDTAGRRRRTARSVAEYRLRHATGGGDPRSASGHTAQALLGYIADRLDLPAGGLTRTEAVQRLRDAAVDAVVVDSVDDILRVCEAAEFGGVDAAAGDLGQRARGVIAELERSRL